MSNSNKIFNVEEATGKEHAALETTAAEAQVEAPTAKIARQVEMNAEDAKNAAQQAANVAKTMGEEYTGELTATDKLQRDASKTTNAAVSEGKNDVDHLKSVGAGYIGQVKALGQTVIETAQTYLPASVANKLPNLSEPTTAPTNDIPTTSAPLESGPHIVSSPYPSTTTKTGTNVAANEGKRIHS